MTADKKVEDIQLTLEDQQANVTVSAVIRVTNGDVALCLFSPEGGECEVFLSPADANRVADALRVAASGAD